MTPATVDIPDDSSAYRVRLAARISSSDRLELAGQFADGPSALRGLLALRPRA